MSNPIKYSTGSESLALKKGNFYIGTGDVGKGPTSTTGFYNGVTPPTGGYTIYLNKATGGPSIYTCTNDANLINLTNSIAGASYTTTNECLNYYNTQSDKLCVNQDYGNIVTDSLIVNLDATFIPSYPKNGNSWYDLATKQLTSNKIGTLNGGPSWNSNGYWEMNNPNDGTRSGSVNGFDLPGVSIDYSSYSFTFESFVYFHSMRSQTSIIANAGSCPGYRWGVNETNMYWLIGPSGGCTGYSEGGVGSNTLTTGTWYQIVGVFDTRNELGGGAKVYAYYNGSLTGSVNITSNLSALTQTPGISRNPCCYGVDGRISIVRIYERALTSNDINQNFQAQRSIFNI